MYNGYINNISGLNNINELYISYCNIYCGLKLTNIKQFYMFYCTYDYTEFNNVNIITIKN